MMSSNTILIDGKAVHLVPGRLLLLEKLTKRATELYYRDKEYWRVLLTLRDLVDCQLKADVTNLSDRTKTIREAKLQLAIVDANNMLDKTAPPKKAKQ